MIAIDGRHAGATQASGQDCGHSGDALHESVRIFRLTLQGFAKTGDALVVFLFVKMAESALIELHSLLGNFGAIVRVDKMDAEASKGQGGGKRCGAANQQ